VHFNLTLAVECYAENHLTAAVYKPTAPKTAVVLTTPDSSLCTRGINKCVKQLPILVKFVLNHVYQSS